MPSLEQISLARLDIASPFAPVDSELGTTIKDILDIIPRDIVMGLLLTNIVPRISFLLEHLQLDVESLQQLIYILTVIAMHAQSSAEDILSCDGFVSTLFSFAFPDNYPLNLIQNGNTASAVLRLLKVLVMSSRSACNALFDSGLLEIITRYIGLPASASSPEMELQLQLISQVFGILTICTAYEKGSKILDDYYNMIFQWFHCLNNVLPQESESVQFTSASICNFITRQLIMNLDLNVGGENDSILPFIQILLQHGFNNTCSIAGNVMRASAIRMLYTYLMAGSRFIGVNSLEFRQARELALNWLTPQDSKTDFVAKSISTINQIDVSCFGSGAGFGFQSPESCQVANLLLDFSVNCDFLAEHSRLHHILSGITKISKSNRNYGEVRSLFYENWVEQLEQIPFQKLNWFRFFCGGVFNLIDSVFHMGYIGKGTPYATLLWILSYANPGDEYLISKILKRVVPNFSKFASSNLSYNKTSFIIWNQKPESPVDSLFIGSGDDSSALPSSDLFFYKLIENEWSHGCEATELILYLGLLIEFETSYSPKLRDPPSALKLFLKLFFIQDKQGNELYLEENIGRSLKELLKAWTQKYRPEDLKFNFDRDSATFQLALQQFDSTAYGNSAFLGYLLLFCTTANDVRFQEMLWKALIDQVRLIKCTIEDAPWGDPKIFTFKNQSLYLDSVYKYFAKTLDGSMPFVESLGIQASGSRN